MNVYPSLVWSNMESKRTVSDPERLQDKDASNSLKVHMKTVTYSFHDVSSDCCSSAHVNSQGRS